MIPADLVRRLEAARHDTFDPDAFRAARAAGFTGRTIEQALQWARQNLDNRVASGGKEKRP